MKQRLVVKVGTSILSTKKNVLSTGKIRRIAAEIYKLLAKGHEVILVTSGAIGSGMNLMKLKTRPKSLEELQACAAVGQAHLMKHYDDFFKSKGLLTAQVLLTRSDLDDRARYLNARNTLLTLLKHKVLPCVNENDTVSTEEIKFGDNDRLSALVANLVGADKLIILSDVDGLYKYEGREKGKFQLVQTIDKITEEVERLATREKGDLSVGGMATKIQAARMVTKSGIPCIVANGRRTDILLRIAEGDIVGTLFSAHKEKLGARKRWIAYSSKTKGAIRVDEGAKKALTVGGKSLLSSGIISCTGQFTAGDCVSILDEHGKEFARGLVNYSADEVVKIKGKRTSEIGSVLGRKCYDEVMHRDNLAIL